MFGKTIVLSSRTVVSLMTGKTKEKSQFLWSDHFPTYMKLGKMYRVLESEDRGIIFPPGDPDYIYMIQDKHQQEEAFFVMSCFRLPKVFWVRGLVTFTIAYEILPEGYDATPFQVQQVRNGSDV